MDGLDRPQLARHVRLTFCRTRQRPILQLPETVVVLNRSGADILALCDGRHTVAEIVAELGARYRTVPDDEVRRFLSRLAARRCVELNHGMKLAECQPRESAHRDEGRPRNEVCPRSGSATHLPRRPTMMADIPEDNDG